LVTRDGRKFTEFDRSVVVKHQVRTVLQAFRDALSAAQCWLSEQRNRAYSVETGFSSAS
jgi:hypothetical protein